MEEITLIKIVQSLISKRNMAAMQGRGQFFPYNYKMNFGNLHLHIKYLNNNLPEKCLGDLVLILYQS